MIKFLYELLAFCKSMNYLVIMRPKQKIYNLILTWFFFRFVYSSSIIQAFGFSMVERFSLNENYCLTDVRIISWYCLWSLIYSYHSPLVINVSKIFILWVLLNNEHNIYLLMVFLSFSYLVSYSKNNLRKLQTQIMFAFWYIIFKKKIYFKKF